MGASYLITIPTAKLPALLKSCFSADLLADMCCNMASGAAAWGSVGPSKVVEYLKALATVHRFDIVCLSMSKKAKVNVTGLFDQLRAEGDIDGLESIAKAFGC